jgi:hypothetical protein
MAFSPFSEALRNAHQALEQDLDGALPLAARRAIWSSFGPVERAGQRILLSAGTVRRARLAERAAMDVLPLWERHRTGDRRPRAMLEALDEYLAGRIDFDRAQAVSDEFNVDLENEGSTSSHLSAGFAALCALNTPLFEAEMQGPYVHCASDADLDPWGWDAGLAASIAAAGGAVSDNLGDAARRRLFWERYLVAACDVTSLLVPS